MTASLFRGAGLPVAVMFLALAGAADAATCRIPRALLDTARDVSVTISGGRCRVHFDATSPRDPAIASPYVRLRIGVAPVRPRLARRSAALWRQAPLSRRCFTFAGRSYCE